MTRLPLRVAQASEMLQRKINEIFNGLPNVFAITDDILNVQYNPNDKECDRTLRKVMQKCCQENIQLNKNQIHFRHAKIPFFQEVISRKDTKMKPQEVAQTKQSVLLLTKKS